MKHSSRTTTARIINTAKEEATHQKDVLFRQSVRAEVLDPLEKQRRFQQRLQEKILVPIENVWKPTIQELPTLDSIHVPDFQHWRGVNDRLAYGTPKVMFEYLSRGVLFRDHPKSLLLKGVTNGEQFTAKYLEYKNITVLGSTVRVIRVRANGKVARFDTLKQGKMNVATDMDMKRCVSDDGTLNYDIC